MLEYAAPVAATIKLFLTGSMKVVLLLLSMEFGATQGDRAPSGVPMVRTEEATGSLQLRGLFGSGAAMASQVGECGRWAHRIATQAAPLGVLEFDYLMHSWGCDQAGDGSWVRAPSRCSTIAYSYRRHGTSSIRALESKLARKGCLHFEDGTWAER